MKDLPAIVRRLEGPDDARQGYCCMTEVPTPWPQALCQCQDWLTINLGKYVEGYHLHLVGGIVVGHLYYAMSDQALISYKVEPNVSVIYCEWVQRRYQKRGFGRYLFSVFLDEMEQNQVKGILVEGTDIEGQMHVDHYLSRGFKVILELGHRKLLYRPITQAEIAVKALQPRIRPRSGASVEILILSGYMCPFESATAVLLQEVAQEFGDQVFLRQVSLTPESLQRYGVAQGIFVNGRQCLAGAETEEAIRRVIIEEIEGG